eukprot:2817992-Rhodomonas_salina.3
MTLSVNYGNACAAIPQSHTPSSSSPPHAPCVGCGDSLSAAAESRLICANGDPTPAARMSAGHSTACCTLLKSFTMPSQPASSSSSTRATN